MCVTVELTGLRTRSRFIFSPSVTGEGGRTPGSVVGGGCSGHELAGAGTAGAMSVLMCSRYQGLLS